MGRGDTFLEKVMNSATSVCPLCKEPLLLSQAVRRQGGVQKAQIKCSSCAGQFEVVARIPVLLPPGQFADWTHPFVEMLFGNIRISVEDAIERYSVDRIKNLYSQLMKGEYKPSLVFDRPVDRKLIASGGRRIAKRAVEKHFRRIKDQTEGTRWIPEMVSQVIEAAPRRLLDACSGGGFFLARLLEEYTDYEQFFSFDIDYNCAKRVEGILRHYEITRKALAMVADARAQPFPSNFFDVITNNYGFSHILGYSKALRETFRILQPGGHLIVRQGFGLNKSKSKVGISDDHGKLDIDFTVDDLMKIHRFGDVYVDKESFLESVRNQGFSIDKIQDFKEYFLVVCSKPK